MAELIGSHSPIQNYGTDRCIAYGKQVIALLQQPAVVFRIPACHIFQRKLQHKLLALARKQLPCLLISTEFLYRLDQLSVRGGVIQLHGLFSGEAAGVANHGLYDDNSVFHLETDAIRLKLRIAQPVAERKKRFNVCRVIIPIADENAFPIARIVPLGKVSNRHNVTGLSPGRGEFARGTGFSKQHIRELLEYICERHDLIAHDVPFSEQPQLLLTRMTLPGIYYQWSYANISGGNYDTASAYNYGNTEKNLLTEFTVADDNNTEQLVLPYSTIDVTHEGERGDSIKAPTEQSLYVEETVAYFNLTPRGIWLTNKDQCVRLHGENIKKVGSEGHNADDWENVDVLDINPNSILASGSLAFSITFYNVDRAKAYQLFFKYSHRDEGLHDSLYISARDKNGWFQLSHAAADVRPANVYPTSNSEVKMNVALNGGQYGEESYESTIRCGMVPEEYITINFYVGAQDLQRLKLYDIRLEATNAINGGLWAKYADQRFVERYPPWSTGEKKILNHALHLNNTFFSNYYETDFGFSNEIPYYLINSQRRIRVTVRAGSLSMFWYMYKYYIEGQTAKWKIIAISYNVRNKTYTLTLHYNSDF